MFKKIKKYIAKEWKIKFKIYLEVLKYIFNKRDLNIKEINDKGKKIYFIGTPNHSNLGDHAIAYAEKLYCKTNFPEYEIIEISDNEFGINILNLKKKIKEKDIIILIGGGNFGIEYFWHEILRRTIIQQFKNNKIILFPQTIDFGKSKEGEKQLRKSAYIYNKNKNVCLLAREKKSYDIMKKYFVACNVELTPDIVLSLDEEDLKLKKSSLKREGILLCLRNDVEKITSDEWLINTKTYLLNKGYQIKTTDTLLEKNIDPKDRDRVLRDKWNEFRKSECVITDRLHGMIFAAITGTRCIALSNYNYKVQGTYEWIKSLDYIKFIEQNSNIDNCFDEIMKTKNNKYIKKENYQKFKVIDHYIKK